eukprot:7759019-Alexandrium_andersonii.AAC.1
MARGLRLPDVGHLVEDEGGIGAAIAGGQEVGAPPEAGDPRVEPVDGPGATSGVARAVPEDVLQRGHLFGIAIGTPRKRVGLRVMPPSGKSAHAA